ncbi:uncharacterized protein Z518_00819 [Rhinocladiella mackenziei CBS 650.93]|uniref:Zn(2)-C6 fungal-type domain-containing protein n=1 Tax=Rhinocladiella mackenziei CBS 650.93 TaxID=1442369 RepID=A0A0D2HGC8_9EURO|nr:uncharacterized protein Z518_00819 [Rhinocladiella mackenziei CBS 650.93]KIX09738.1 hypothetical protein Z518_00819 [Rhinocladiella mackenziei CBS 650.93]
MSVTTCTTTATRRKHISGKRTNSLGWAKSDCHTCSSLRRHCDRRRPRCSACLADGVICSGYVQQLNWERGSLRLGKSKSKTPSTWKESENTKPEDASPQLPQPSAFIFVGQNELADRSKKKQRNNSKSSGPTTQHPSPRNSRSASTSLDPISPSSPSSTWSLARTNTPPSIYVASNSALGLSPQVGRHPGEVEDALAFYHSCFSYITLTFDVHVNPWQAVLPQVHDDIPCVRYAAIALAQRQQAHLRNKSEGLSVLNLKTHALSIFATHLNELSFESGISTSLLLIALDYADTGFSNWTIHLRGAFRILESNGGIRLAESRPNLRSQIAMLIWYDVTAALISRCGPTFPRRYLEALMMWQSENEWSILALNGLPDGMFLDMYDMAMAAADRESVSPDTVAVLEAKILNAEIDGQGNQHLVQMSQVWKLGLLLYCSRVFSRFQTFSSPEDCPIFQEMTDSSLDADLSPSSRLDPHALSLRILSIVADLPSHSNFQKQCLLPIILAACEMSAAEWEYRKIAVEYSERWKQKTGIWIFDSGLEFMRGVWAKNDAVGDAQEEGANEEAREGITVPWTEIYPSGIEYGFLFG